MYYINPTFSKRQAWNRQIAPELQDIFSHVLQNFYQKNPNLFNVKLKADSLFKSPLFPESEVKTEVLLRLLLYPLTGVDQRFWTQCVHRVHRKSASAVEMTS